ncbi:MAG: succinate dehydrogenase/fumarate reductase iron-sulfur subunit [Pseudomonadales bacterium]|nr:succinate dehydrogenase/fumarate reductase iron-sulfur subunit [Pseudomonadales bacterium]
MKLKLKIWRQASKETQGALRTYELDGVEPDDSFLEMLDQLNQQLAATGEEPVAFDHDCREGICGMCSLVINGTPHSRVSGVTTCQTYMRHFRDGDTIVVEPFRAAAFPVIKDLVVDRSALDEIIAAGGYISVKTGHAQDANDLLISKEVVDLSMDAASCIGCGACIAACRNASAMLFIAAKTTHLGVLPQGDIEQPTRVLNMIRKADELGFGSCSNELVCEAVCPKGISVSNIARMNRTYLAAALASRKA